MIRIMMLSAVLLAVVCYAADQIGVKEKFPINGKAPTEMKQYWLVLLKKGASRMQDSSAIEAIQAAHMRNINNLEKSGVLIVGGPVGNDGDLRGIFILDALDSVAAVRIVHKDSAIATGRLRAEIFPWWTEKGTYVFK